MTAVAKKAARFRPAAIALTVCAAVVPGCSSSVLDDPAASTTVTVGAGDAADETLLAYLYAGALRTTGIDVEVRTGLDDPAAALDAAEVTLVPGYTGRLLDRYDPGAGQTDAEDVFAALARALPDELTVSDYASAQDRAVLLADTAALAAGSIAAGSVTTVADLVPRCPELTLLVTESFGSAGGLDALDAVDCRPREIRTVDDERAVADLTGPGLLLGTTTTLPALSGTGTDATVKAVPDVPDRTSRDEADADVTAAPVFPAQNVVPVLRKGILGEPQLDALRTIAGELTTADLAELRARIDDGEDRETVARTWLEEHA
ncbi:ABC transporter substrate-binding protein [Rhodococcus sp. Z13]|uniref:ABC transporter substrate-binding protein n=1 Tax=Rhodococcus sacchari TaxID=2962047 RepID=A0ACD4DJF2_9NOCA|nr:glycine betaine ABC transporter substrate-binding protein [Rhodococcus sp. Z13]UYP20088.1 ABC transporter substrate-binding protein [Rhodococcus sp. Z13]